MIEAGLRILLGAVVIGVIGAGVCIVCAMFIGTLLAIIWVLHTWVAQYIVIAFAVVAGLLLCYHIGNGIVHEEEEQP